MNSIKIIRINKYLSKIKKEKKSQHSKFFINPAKETGHWDKSLQHQDSKNILSKLVGHTCPKASNIPIASDIIRWLRLPNIQDWPHPILTQMSNH